MRWTRWVQCTCCEAEWNWMVCVALDSDRGEMCHHGPSSSLAQMNYALVLRSIITVKSLRICIVDVVQGWWVCLSSRSVLGGQIRCMGGNEVSEFRISSKSRGPLDICLSNVFKHHRPIPSRCRSRQKDTR